MHLKSCGLPSSSAATAVLPFHTFPKVGANSQCSSCLVVAKTSFVLIFFSIVPPEVQCISQTLHFQISSSSPTSLEAMASHLRDEILHGHDHLDTHASDNRWRHQESASFARHAAQAATTKSASTITPRRANERTSSKDLAEFLYTSRFDPPKSSGSGSSSRHTPIVISGNVYDGAGLCEPNTRHQENKLGEKGAAQVLEVKCGPLLNYKRMENGIWFGSVLVITKGGGPQGTSAVVPELHLKLAVGAVLANVIITNGVTQGKEIAANSTGLTNTQGSSNHATTTGTQENDTADGAVGDQVFKTKGIILYSDPANTFWRFDIKVPMQQHEMRCDYEIPGLSFPNEERTDKQSFFVPGISDSMKIMFYS